MSIDQPIVIVRLSFIRQSLWVLGLWGSPVHRTPHAVNTLTIHYDQQLHATIIQYIPQQSLKSRATKGKERGVAVGGYCSSVAECRLLKPEALGFITGGTTFLSFPLLFQRRTDSNGHDCLWTITIGLRTVGESRPSDSLCCDYAHHPLWSTIAHSSHPIHSSTILRMICIVSNALQCNCINRLFSLSQNCCTTAKLDRMIMFTYYPIVNCACYASDKTVQFCTVTICSCGFVSHFSPMQVILLVCFSLLTKWSSYCMWV